MENFFENFFLGINYWDSKNAIKMWENYDSQLIESDFKKMKDAKITHLRTFLMWPDFQPLTAFYKPEGKIYEWGINGKPLPDTEAGQAGVSEEMCKNFEDFCRLADKYGFKLIVGLLTGHMSSGLFVPPALYNKNMLKDPTAIKWEIKFVKYFVNRFKDERCIAAWDLGNELNYTADESLTSDDAYVWMSTITNTIKSVDDKHYVISGMDTSEIDKGFGIKAIGEICDAHTVHRYNIWGSENDQLNSMKPVLSMSYSTRFYEDIAKVPCFIQEFGAIGYMTCTYETEADFYRTCLYNSFANDCRGVMWWCAFDQGKIDFRPYDWNSIGSNYGFFDNDCRPKPLVDENIKFAELLDKFPQGFPASVKNATIIVQRDGECSFESYIMAKRAGINPSFCYALDKIPDSDLYIMPSLTAYHAIPKCRLNELLEKVKGGANLYVSADYGFIRDFNEIFGLDVLKKEGVNDVCTINLNGEQLPVSRTTKYTLKPVTAKVLAYDNDNQPVFTVNDYGKGKIFLLSVPVEAEFSKCGAACDESLPNYELIYNAIKHHNNQPAAECDSRFIHVTEHIADERTRYICAVNYSDKDREEAIAIDKKYKT